MRTPCATLLITVLSLSATLVFAGCSSSSVVNTGDTATPSESVQPTTPPTRPSNEKLVNAFDYYTNADGTAGYYFVTPTGTWRCVIAPRAWVGCQSTSGAGRIGITGAPQTVTDEGGQTVPPNAIAARTVGKPRFESIPDDKFNPASGTAKTLPYNKILAAAGFRCNVQEQFGVSCFSEEADNGFTFTSEKFSWQYTDVP